MSGQQPKFCEHDVHPCLFCGVIVRLGHYGENENTVIHDHPQCPEYKDADNAIQFMLLSRLKHKSDLGQLERN